MTLGDALAALAEFARKLRENSNAATLKAAAEDLHDALAEFLPPPTPTAEPPAQAEPDTAPVDTPGL